MPTNYAFIGLILGSIPILLKKIHSQKHFRMHYLIYSIIAFGIGLLMVIVENYIENSIYLTIDTTFPNTLSTISLPSIAFLIIAGFFMSIGIVVPRHQ